MYRSGKNQLQLEASATYSCGTRSHSALLYRAQGPIRREEGTVNERVSRKLAERLDVKGTVNKLSLTVPLTSSNFYSAQVLVL